MHYKDCCIILIKVIMPKQCILITSDIYFLTYNQKKTELNLADSQRLNNL